MQKVENADTDSKASFDGFSSGIMLNINVKWINFLEYGVEGMLLIPKQTSFLWQIQEQFSARPKQQHISLRNNDFAYRLWKKVLLE